MLKGQNYCINAKNLLCHEMIGLQVKVIESTDKNKAGIFGTVIDESKNLFLIKTLKGVKMVPKKEAKFLFSLDEEKVLVDGQKIVVRPEDRVKYFWRRS